MPAFIYYGLLLLAPLMALGLAYALSLASDQRTRTFLRVAGLLLGWLAVQFVLAELTVFHHPHLPTYLLVALPADGLALGYVLWVGRARLRKLPLVYLVMLNALRLPLWLCIGMGSGAGLLPHWDYFPIYQFDWLLGLVALGFYFLLPEVESQLSKPKQWLLIGYNILGIISFASGVAVIGMAIPDAWHTATAMPPTTLVLDFPGVWLPAILGPGIFFTHFAMLRKLFQRLLNVDLEADSLRYEKPS